MLINQWVETGCLFFILARALNLLTIISKMCIINTHKKNYKMEKEKRDRWQVVFWHNDFPDNSRQNNKFGENGVLFKKVADNIPSEVVLEWHFHGGLIRPERTVLLNRLKQADVLIAACPWNMDIQNNGMGWRQAERSLLEILEKIKKENEKLKIFFVQEPHHALEEFQALGEIVDTVLADSIYNYFLEK